MKIIIKRAYDKPEKGDGTRVLVDRLWPRGVAKAKVHIDLWAKQIAPSTELRKWFHIDPKKRYEDFAKKYAGELKMNPAFKEFKMQARKMKTLTLITAAKDPEHSHVFILARCLK